MLNGREGIPLNGWDINITLQICQQYSSGTEEGIRFENVWPHHGAHGSSHCTKIMTQHTSRLFVTKSINQYHSISDQERESECVQIDRREVASIPACCPPISPLIVCHYMISFICNSRHNFAPRVCEFRKTMKADNEGFLRLAGAEDVVF